MISFSNTWLLAGLIAVGLPVAIHYLTKPRPRQVEFPMVRFLVEAAAGKQAWNRLRTILVLTLRCLAVLMLVALFARPFIQDRSASAGDQSLDRVVVIVDASLSMKAAKGGVTLFDRARVEAVERLKNLPANTAAAVVMMKARPEPILPALTTNIPALVNRLKKASPGNTLGRPMDAMAMASGLLENTGHIFVYSDFQKTNWENASPAVSQDISVHLHPVNAPAMDNMAVTSIEISPPNPVAGQKLRLEATVLNCSATPVSRPVTLEFMGERFTKDINAAPYQSVIAGFEIIPRTPGDFSGKVSCENSDSLSEDNARYFKLTVNNEFFVLIMGDDDVSDFSGATFFPATAVCPGDPLERGIRTVVRHSQDAGDKVLKQANAYILCPPLTLSDSMARTIFQKVRRGANLLLFMDGKTTGPMLETLAAGSQGKITPPFKMIAQVEAQERGGTPLADILLSHPVFAQFSDEEAKGMESIRSARFFATRDMEGRKNEIPMHYSDGSAGLAVSPCGLGTVFYCNIPGASGGGNFVGSPLFPVLVQECLNMKVNINSEDTRPGESWDIHASHASPSSGISIAGPQGDIRDFKAFSLGEKTKLAMAPVMAPGIYTASGNGRTIGIGVVNIDPQESDLRTLAPAELIQARAEAKGSVSIAGPETLEKRRTKELWPHAGLWLCLFLMGEMIVLAFWRKIEPIRSEMGETSP